MTAIVVTGAAGGLGSATVGRLAAAGAAVLAAWLLLEGPAYPTGAVLPVDGAQTTG
jgi:NAD(P)-dependent dehydrogenase (short-subunit alcohol dehydrogenase family)